MLRQNRRTAPEVWIPVTAEDVRRKRLREIALWSASMLAVVLLIWVVYRRSIDPQQARQTYDAGVRLYNSARYQEAILDFNRALNLQSDMTDAYRMRGRAFAGQDDADHAIQDFDKVIQLQPRDAGAWVERGLIYLNKKDFPKAIADAKAALALDPKLARAYNLRGTALRAAGEPQKALADFSHAVVYDPSLDNFFQRAATYQLLNQHRQAISDFDKAIEISPEQPHIYFARAKSKTALGDHAGAESDFKAGRKLDVF